MDTTIINSLFDELEKIAFKTRNLFNKRNPLKSMANMGGRGEVIGLAILAAPSMDNMIAKIRARAAGYKHPNDHTLNKFRMLKEKYHDAAEVGGLSILAAPYIAKRLLTGKWGH